MKVLTIVGARPQFIKAAPVTKALREAGQKEILVHTGQHYDQGMSKVFFDEMQIPEPNVNLQVGSGSHGWQTGEILARVEPLMLEHKPDWVLVYGDTNSTLAGALAASKLDIPLAHVEAGLRSFNRTMPEEHNRVLTDHCAALLFCPTQTAVDNLAREGITERVSLVGDTMFDAVRQFAAIANQRSSLLSELELRRKQYLLATLHRPYNTDAAENLTNIFSALRSIPETIVLPVHPRLRKMIDQLGIPTADDRGSSNLRMIDPVGYLDMLMLEQHARMILTDSGGVQKEAYFFGIPCVTLRPETEWLETLVDGWNVVVGADPERIRAAVLEREVPAAKPQPVFGDGHAADRIVRELRQRIAN